MQIADKIKVGRMMLRLCGLISCVQAFRKGRDEFIPLDHIRTEKPRNYTHSMLLYNSASNSSFVFGTLRQKITVI